VHSFNIAESNCVQLDYSAHPCASPFGFAKA
jgi:hypothetical protein